ncbi:hypothetical protein N7486_007447 [Penicillium sp. IBT 16267x]|nr:hypothetical protein N7486_007447 [Penicillium sp. IBT 16267x]
MEDNDDDYFSDEFDSLPPGTLFDLEQSAFQATQGHATQYQHSPTVPNDSTLHTQVKPAVHNSATLQPPPRLHTGLTNDYDTLEVGELGAEIHDNAGGSVALPNGHRGLVKEHGWPVNSGIGDAMEVDDHTPGNISGGNARLEQLEREKEQLRIELLEAKAQVQAKTGEIAIIRSKQAQMTANYDQQLIALRMAMAEESTKHKEIVEAAMSEGHILATENIFLQHDLAEEAHHLRNFKSKQRQEEHSPVTPKKSRNLPFRDGFDDDEIAVVSPSKSTGRSKRATPTVPGKRKRLASQDTPVPLQLSPAGELVMVDAPADDLEPDREEVPEPLGRDQQVMKRLLNHRMVPDQETDIEALARISFPSEPGRAMSSMVLDRLAQLDMGSYVVEYMHTIGPLWQRALTERFYEPVPRFMTLVRFVLKMNDIPLPKLISPLVSVLQDSVEVNAVPRFRYSPAAREKARVIRSIPTPQSDLQPQVDSTEALRLLYHIASELLHVKEALQDFWRQIRHTFTLVMLHPSQPLKDIVLILHLLSTSIRPESFGPIMPSEGEQNDIQRWLVDRLSFMFSERAQPDEGLAPYTPHDICAMRLEVLLLLESLAFNPAAPTREHGSAIIAAHPNALARLFRSMHDELDALYSSPPEQELRVALVNGLMRLVFGVIRRHGSSINMQEKLARVPGSKQKHLVVLTRLAFCDGSVLEAGVDDETVDMAHDLLEEWTNPQEADSLAEVFPSSRRE